MGSSNHFSKFSVINTNVKLYVDGPNHFVKKTIKPNLVYNNVSIDKIKSWIDRYIEILIKANIPLPPISDEKIIGKNIIYNCDFMGKNITQLFSPIESIIDNKIILDKIIEIIYCAQKNDVYLDPHPKNFVVKGEEVFYVDFTPPYQIKEYRDSRLGLESNRAKKKFIYDNFKVFSPINLFYHFIGDFLKISSNSTFINLLYKKISHNGFLLSNIEEGMTIARSIRKLEDERDLKGIKLF